MLCLVQGDLAGQEGHMPSHGLRPLSETPAVPSEMRTAGVLPKHWRAQRVGPCPRPLGAQAVGELGNNGRRVPSLPVKCLVDCLGSAMVIFGDGNWRSYPAVVGLARGPPSFHLTCRNPRVSATPPPVPCSRRQFTLLRGGRHSA
jgi:hypothetical protein